MELILALQLTYNWYHIALNLNTYINVFKHNMAGARGSIVHFKLAHVFKELPYGQHKIERNITP